MHCFQAACPGAIAIPVSREELTVVMMDPLEMARHRDEKWKLRTKSVRGRTTS